MVRGLVPREHRAWFALLTFVRPLLSAHEHSCFLLVSVCVSVCVCLCSYVCVCVCVSHETIECRILNAGSLEMWGGATFDVALRCLHECPLKLHMCACMCMHVMKTIKHRILHAGSLEMWGGATFDVALRYLHECPLKLRMCACMCVHV